ncbi:MAG TPA: hypothetical protein K8V04_02070, partial [Flavonifractor plautii]|nr:hypothetical protein [Flavonifractor plautii]
SGTCGRLMCCLKYEQEAYEDAVKRMPKNESFVETPDGVGTVTQVNLLKETVKVRLDDQPESPKCFHNCEICVVRNGKGKLPEGYVPPPPEELAKLRKVTPAEEPRRLAGSLDAALSHLGVSPAAEAPVEAPARRSRRRGGRGKSAQQQPVQREERPAPPPKPTENPPAGEKGGEKKRPHRRRWRGKPRGGEKGPRPEA